MQRNLRLGHIKTNKMIYFIGNLEKIKIGHSSKIKSRISTIRVSCPFEAELLLLLEGGKEVEKMLHSKFNEYKIRGEWFNMSIDIKNFIQENKVNNISLNYKSKPRKHKILTELRNSKGLTLKEVGDILGITSPLVSDFEFRFETKSISLKSLENYVKALGSELLISFK